MIECVLSLLAHKLTGQIATSTLSAIELFVAVAVAVAATILAVVSVVEKWQMEAVATENRNSTYNNIKIWNRPTEKNNIFPLACR